MSSPTRKILGQLPIVPTGTRNQVPVTPRKRKTPAPDRLLGIKQLQETLQDVKVKTRQRLGLDFDVDDWQGELIRRLRQGYDSLMLAGTGYGKSIIFEALAALNKAKIVIVVCPLKALERDQVNEAQKKGLKAVMVNEDTVSPEIWASLRQGHANLYYVSPEMALSSSFIHLWQDRSFRNRVQALVIDEAHCIVEWGDDFRKEYSGLAKLRDYIGQDTPILAATATCDTEAFKVIWKSLKFGCRPFWGIDVGTDRSNLVYITRIIKNPANPILDIINIFPAQMDKNTPAIALPKCLFYFDTIEACATAVETLRKCLPAHLRPLVQTFKSTVSEGAKELVWDRFNKGEIRILCATDAAGMGCNFLLRDGDAQPATVKSSEHVFFLFRADGERRKKLNSAMEAFVNADLDTYHCLNQESRQPVESGWRSKASQRELSWTVLDLKRSPPSDRCCGRCTPDILSRYPASDRHDARLKAFASDFLFSIPSFSRGHRQMDSVSSTESGTSETHSPTRAVFLPFLYKVVVPQQQRDDLVAVLDKWRTEKQARRAGGRSLLSKRVDLSDGQLQKLADHGADFLRETTVTPDLICKFVPWDLASHDDLTAVASIIMDWRLDAQLAIGLTPRGGHRLKQQNTLSTPPRAATSNTSRRNAQTLTQPSFSPARILRGRPRGRGEGRGRGGSQARTAAANDADFFAPSMAASVPPRTMATRSGSGPQATPLQPSLSHTSPPAFAPPNPTQLLPPNPYAAYYSAAYAYPPHGSSKYS
ncbi:P-loop containing nucleoside triphosphate hydrolase protein [Mycena galericulata]|nr:P-loop containing nucleoside triphosphate hydrolase protein [Mycena galericulata]